jgi:hypothetical protein
LALVLRHYFNRNSTPITARDWISAPHVAASRTQVLAARIHPAGNWLRMARAPTCVPLESGAPGATLAAPAAAADSIAARNRARAWSLNK